MDDKLSRRPVVFLSSLSSYLGKLFLCLATSSSVFASKLATLDVLSASQRRDRSNPPIAHSRSFVNVALVLSSPILPNSLCTALFFLGFFFSPLSSPREAISSKAMLTERYPPPPSSGIYVYSSTLA